MSLSNEGGTHNMSRTLATNLPTPNRSPLRATRCAMGLASFAAATLSACPAIDAAAQTPAPDRVAPTAILAGTILTVDAGTISPGVVLIRDGKIEAVLGDSTVPAGYRLIDASSRVLIPGLVDAHTHLGLREVPITSETFETTENTRPFTADVRVEDSIDLRSMDFRTALSHGTTTAVVLPGSSNLVSGLGLVVKTRGERGEVADKEPLQATILASPRILKMALAMNPKSAYGRKGLSPKTRMGAAAMLRERLEEARQYRAGQSSSVELDPQLEPLRRALDGDIRVHIHAARADDILTAHAVINDFGLRASIGHAYEAYLVAAELARTGVPVVIGPKLEGWYRGTTPETPINLGGQLADAGVEVSIMTDGYVDDLLLQAAYAVRLGMGEEAALRAITLHPANSLGLGDRIGSLAAGKDADIVLLDGAPFEPGTTVVKVLVEGEVVFDRTESP